MNEKPGMYRSKREAAIKLLGTIIGAVIVTLVAIIAVLLLLRVVDALWDGGSAAYERPLTPEATMRLVLPVEAPETIDAAAEASAPAVRLDPPTTTLLVFATDCEEMSWYRTQAGLPEVFDQIGWRESNCRNEDGVRTFCCYGWWQNYMSSHLSPQSAYRERIINDCGVTSYRDVNSDTPEDKVRQACVTFVVYSISGLGPWQ